MRGNIYQTSLIGLGITATVLYGAFFYREIFPEYKLYQKDFAALEEFRSSYTGEPPAPFEFGVKQIVLEDERNGPPLIDRCISCHVALEIDSYSPTKIAYDINGNIQLNADGFPLQIDNENYVWKKLDEKIADLTDEKVNAQLKEEGKNSEVSKRLAQAEEYEALKTVKVGEHIYDTRKVLAMHPLIGRETRPFLYHPTEEYGCTSCHSGNGNGLTTEKAHGPVFDHQYETAFEGYVPQFTENDAQNDPAFANAYNHKPGDALLFQTTPILVGALIQAKCAQCHKTSDALLEGLYGIANNAATQSRNRINAVTADYDNQIQAFLTMVEVKQLLSKKGYDETIATLIKEEQDFSLPAQKLKLIGAEKDYLLNIKKEGLDVPSTLNHQIEKMVGDTALTTELEKQVSDKQQDKEQVIKKFVDQNRANLHATGSLFTKLAAANLEKAMIEHVVDTEGSLGQAVNDQQSMGAMQSDIDYLTKTLKNGQNLFISQACYACHRISGYSRGGVGPDLTEEGKKYPWFVKQSIVWPNADTNVRNMPTMHLDHVELESLLTYVLAQTGHKPSESRTNYAIAVHEWEAGKQMPWEKPVPPDKVRDVNYAMEVFATEGCASCHRLEGFDSNVGFAIEKDKTKPDFDAVYKEKQWFQSLFPEESPGSQLVAAIENHTADIDKRIAGNVRQNSILEELEKKHPSVIESYYSNFRYASRAKNHDYQELLAKEKDPRKKEQLSAELDAWKERVHRVLMVYIQEYGLGRLVGPRPNWSGVYRTDQWLMEHFRNPSAHSPNSIMPAFPFDDSKFMSLTHMLDVLGIRNRNAVHAIWDHHGFNPEQAFEIHCAQCHGTYKQGNGPVAEWIYPIPKNLTNSDFLKNLTRERAIQSITHGIIGTPMPPWGEAAGDKSTADGIPVLSKEEIHRMVDWLYSSFPGNENPQSLKWDYKIDDVMDELKREGTQLDAKSGLSYLLPKADNYYAAMNPVVSKKIPGNESEIFEVKSNSTGYADKDSFYIKHKYYTPENIEAGQQFFELNCAVCHGKEGDGTGLRAEAMSEAKPRMLIDTDWLATQDDLNLLRAIKYGVPGTAMVPWGDQSSVLQRLQLVIFIRSLSQESMIRDQLQSILYKTFDVAKHAVDVARSNDYTKINDTQKKLKAAKQEQDSLKDQFKNGKAETTQLVQIYQQILELQKQLQTYQEEDQQYVKLNDLVEKERMGLFELGRDLVESSNYGLDTAGYFKMVSLSENRIKAEGPHLVLTNDPQREQEFYSIGQSFIDTLNKKLKELKEKNALLSGKIASSSIQQQLDDSTIEIAKLEKLKDKFISTLADTKRFREDEKKTIENLDKNKS